MNQFAQLSQKDLADLLDIITVCSSWDSENQFSRIFTQLQALISFDSATCTYANPQAYFAGNEKAATVFNYNYPLVLIERYLEHKQYDYDIQLNAFSRTGELQNFNDAIRRYNDGVPGVVDLECFEHGITDGWMYGIGNLDSASLALINLFGAHIENNARSRIIAQVAIIHICECYKRVLRIKEKSHYRLTPREIEVLHWLKEGKTSWEISKILQISERTAIFHINNVKTKLNAVNRTQAVAIALGKGLISL